MSTEFESQKDAELKNRDSRFKDILLPRLTPLLSVMAILVALFAAFSKGPEGAAEILERLKNSIPNIIIYSNIIISAVAFIFLAREQSDPVFIRDKGKFKSLAELPESADVNIYTSNLNDRVERLVSQFKLNMILFAGSLVLVYTIIALTKYAGPDDKDGVGVISYFRVATNLMNLLGALFVHCGFFVLYNKTLVAESTKSGKAAKDADEQFRLETKEATSYYSNQYWAMPLLIVVPYTLIFITLSVAKLGHGGDHSAFLNLADLFAGSYNGLAMSLLFGRYVSIEQVMRNTSRYSNVFKRPFYPFSNVSYKTLATLGIVFILPIYALAQPLFGNLRLTEFGNAETFQSWVFAVCLLGKICFFHLTYILISKKILHLYIYGMASSVGNFKELETCFEDEKPPKERAFEG